MASRGEQRDRRAIAMADEVRGSRVSFPEQRGELVGIAGEEAGVEDGIARR
jgi:hypothetical protein